MTEAQWQAEMERQRARWAGTLALLADWDTWCSDPACPQCTERHRRNSEEPR